MDRVVLSVLGERPPDAASDDEGETTGVEAISQAIARIIDQRLNGAAESSVIVRSTGMVTTSRIVSQPAGAGGADDGVQAR